MLLFFYCLATGWGQVQGDLDSDELNNAGLQTEDIPMVLKYYGENLRVEAEHPSKTCFCCIVQPFCCQRSNAYLGTLLAAIVCLHLFNQLSEFCCK